MKTFEPSFAFRLLVLVFLVSSCEKKVVPIIETSVISNITTTTALGGGTITDEGSGTIVEKGVCWSTSITPTIEDNHTNDGGGASAFTSNLTSLDPGSTYFVRAYATNLDGTGYGMALSFKTLGDLPNAITLPATKVIKNSAILHGKVNANLLPTRVYFEYGTGLTYGNIVEATANPISGDQDADVAATITGLFTETYHFRIKAENSLGISYGEDETFVALVVTDIDGNTYSTIQIGNQTWMAENLKTISYRNGDLIGTTVPATLDILSEINPKYQWAYDGEESNVATYGRLYTWSAAMDSRGLCPTGWHLPSDYEWKLLEISLGMTQSQADLTWYRGTNQGTQMKSTSGWDNNGNGTNSSGFNVFPGGHRRLYFETMGNSARFWTSSEGDGGYIWQRGLSSTEEGVFRRDNMWKTDGISVRCVKD
jgi:uncharacterized protein (TIGR02145 family)